MAMGRNLNQLVLQARGCGKGDLRLWEESGAFWASGKRPKRINARCVPSICPLELAPPGVGDR